MPFSENHAVQIKNAEAEAWTKAFRDKYKFDFYAAGFRTIFEYLQQAVQKAGAVDVTKIAYAMEGMSHKDFLGYDALIRKDDHQLMSVYHVGVFKKGEKYDSEGTGLGWKTAATVLAKDVEQPTSCKMKRPPGA